MAKGDPLKVLQREVKSLGKRLERAEAKVADLRSLRKQLVTLIEETGN